MRLALMGTGSLGTILGAFISEKKEIELIDVNKEHVKALNDSGARIVGTIEKTVPVKAITPEEMEGMYDLVILLVKQTYNASAFESLRNHIHDKTIIATLQNGFPEPSLIDVFGEDRVIGATVSWGATWQGPGVSELTSDPEKLAFDVGRLDGKVTEQVEQVKEVLECMCPAHIAGNLGGTRWAKLLSNAVFSGLSACFGCTFGEILSDEKLEKLAHYVMKETIDVGTKWGVTSFEVDGVDLKPYLYFETEEERVEKAPSYQAFWGPHKLLKASMLQDIEKGRKTEINEINGLVVHFGKKLGIETPLNEMIVSIVSRIERKELEPSLTNLSSFK